MLALGIQLEIVHGILELFALFERIREFAAIRRGSLSVGLFYLLGDCGRRAGSFGRRNSGGWRFAVQIVHETNYPRGISVIHYFHILEREFAPRFARFR